MNSKDIGNKLRQLRGSRSQREVSQAIGVSCAAYSMYETGKRIPRDTTKVKIANYYNRSVTSIFFAK